MENSRKNSEHFLTTKYCEIKVSEYYLIRFRADGREERSSLLKSFHYHKISIIDFYFRYRFIGTILCDLARLWHRS